MVMAVVRRFRVAMVMSVPVTMAVLLRMPVSMIVFVRMIVRMRIVVIVMIVGNVHVELCARNAALLRAGAVQVITIELKLRQFLFERRWIHS